MLMSEAILWDLFFKKEKEHPECHPLGAHCENIRIEHDIDFPTVSSVENWRDCLLCLLTEILTELKEKGDVDA
jgi:hypothetical protein